MGSGTLCGAPHGISPEYEDLCGEAPASGAVQQRRSMMAVNGLDVALQQVQALWLPALRLRLQMQVLQVLQVQVLRLQVQVQVLWLHVQVQVLWLHVL